VRYIDSHGLVSKIASDEIILDTTLPTASMNINEDASYTGTNEVILHLECWDANGIRTLVGCNDQWFSEPIDLEVGKAQVQWDLSADKDGEAWVYVSVTEEENSGVAVVNSSKDEPIVLDLVLVNEVGTEVATGELEVSPGGQVARYVDEPTLLGEYFNSIDGKFKGTLNLLGRDGRKSSVVGLIQNRTTGALIAVRASGKVFSPGSRN
jgi:hypothetical protein